MSFLLAKATFTTVTLRNPSWGNSYSIDNNDIKRFTRSGTLRVFSDPLWAVSTVHKYQFSRIEKTVITSLKVFLEGTAGLLVNIDDHLGNRFSGYIVSPVNEIVAVRPDCSYDVGFEILVIL
jgi:hypothetical protein